MANLMTLDELRQHRDDLAAKRARFEREEQLHPDFKSLVWAGVSIALDQAIRGVEACMRQVQHDNQKG